MIARLMPALLLTAAIYGQDKLSAFPARVTLDSGLDSHAVIALRTDSQGLTRDVTGAVVVEFAPPGIAQFDRGMLLPKRNGEATVTLRHDNLTTTIKVTVNNTEASPPISYRNDIIPILTRAGCNSGACHGAASGKNGFGLTLFGFDPGKDLRALTRDYRGRRLDCADPKASLILTKPTTQVRHKGGKRFEANSEMWHKIRSWIAAGAIDDGANPKHPLPELKRLQVEPRELVLGGAGQKSKLVVTAEYSDGSLRDVTDLALISSSNPTSATVKDGLITSNKRGEAFMLARFGYLAQVANIIVLPNSDQWEAPKMQSNLELSSAETHAANRLSKPWHSSLPSGPGRITGPNLGVLCTSAVTIWPPSILSLRCSRAAPRYRWLLVSWPSTSQTPCTTRSSYRTCRA